MIQIHTDRCAGCGLCAADCVQNNIVIENNKATVKGDCFLCGHCVAVCPAGAVENPAYADDAPVAYNTETFSLPTENLLNAIAYRRSVRRYTPAKIEDEKLKALAYAGRHAATAKNTQNCRFIFVQQELEAFKKLFWEDIALHMEEAPSPGLQKIMRIFYNGRNGDPCGETLFRNAPALVFIVGDAVDVGIAAQAVELTGYSMGLGAMYNGFLSRIASFLPGVRSWLNLQEKESIATTLLLGYPAVHYARTAPRRTDGVEFR